jgi:predicted nucleic acid-binding protein
VNVVDSSGWIEFFTGGSFARRFEPYLADDGEVLTPTIVLYEVYKLVRRERTEEDALRAAAALKRTTVVPLTDSIALVAADLALELGLAMADAIVYATARLHGAEVITSDEDFEGLPGVKYFGKKKRRKRRGSKTR